MQCTSNATSEPSTFATDQLHASIPDLEPHCGSWVVSHAGTGLVIGEFYVRRNLERFKPQDYLIETAATYLGRINSQIRSSANIS